jgi:hypothetical protein
MNKNNLSSLEKSGQMTCLNVFKRRIFQKRAQKNPTQRVVSGLKKGNDLLSHQWQYHQR